MRGAVPHGGIPVPADPGAAPPVLHGVDRAAFAVALVTRLRSRAVAVGATAVGDFVRALATGTAQTRSGLYWTARVTLVRRHGDLEAFDAVFAALFDQAGTEVGPGPRRGWLHGPAPGDTFTAVRGQATSAEEAGSGLPWVTLPPAVAAADDADADGAVTVPERAPSNVSALLDVPFEQLSHGQLEMLGAWIERSLPTWPKRRSRRVSPSRGGHRVDVRATLAGSRRTGWEPVHLVRVRAVDTPRQVVLLCDVSQSMQAQATAYLHLMRALVVGAHAEVFAFATTVTRLTSVLSHRSAQVAVDQATAKVVDRFGGTRIATNLASLLSSVHGGALRGAVVVIASDGWDADTPAELAAAMARLRRRAHRIIWMNPRVAAPGYQPLVATMAAALPFCDAFLPADTFGSLAAVVEEIARPAGQGGPWPARPGR